ncbi:hypothetical protein MVI01_62640 [Myxococcus virescens]|uniref:Uncharacterized protein n=1 Tax=Myxococcus virescens TaxID=83456 RepID=A0A511HLN6_9BACT|nr:hypothetical protein MVI01_62640 [Myxococcus virescens]
MIREDGNCSVCGCGVEWSVVQSIGSRKELRWSRGMHCGNAVEEDDIGFPSEQIRSAFIEAQGQWSLHLLDAAHRSNAVREMRRLLGLDLNAAARLIRAPLNDLWSGTETEARWIALHLHRLGVLVAVTRQNS